jgi:serine/threonine protein kinase
MAIPLMGPSVERLHQLCDNKFSLRTCAKLGIQMIEQIEICHRKGVLHRDIKPANFLINYSLPHTGVKLVDFGLSKRFRDAPCRTGVPRVGSLRWMSKNTHKAIESSFSDDIYSIGYMIIYLFVGNLPWKGVIQNMTMDEKHVAVLSVKEKFTNSRLACKNACVECTSNSVPCQFVIAMIKFLDYTDTLAYGQVPNYQALKTYLEEALVAHGNVLEPWDWEKKF